MTRCLGAACCVCVCMCRHISRYTSHVTLCRRYIRAAQCGCLPAAVVVADSTAGLCARDQAPTPPPACAVTHQPTAPHSRTRFNKQHPHSLPQLLIPTNTPSTWHGRKGLAAPSWTPDLFFSTGSPCNFDCPGACAPPLLHCHNTHAPPAVTINPWTCSASPMCVHPPGYQTRATGSLDTRTTGFTSHHLCIWHMQPLTPPPPLLLRYGSIYRARAPNVTGATTSPTPCAAPTFHVPVCLCVRDT